jgi:hypothetical protein
VRVVRWVVGGTAAGLFGGFLAGLLRGRRPGSPAAPYPEPFPADGRTASAGPDEDEDRRSAGGSR